MQIPPPSPACQPPFDTRVRACPAACCVRLLLAGWFSGVLSLGAVSPAAFAAGLLGSVLLTLAFTLAPAVQVARIPAAEAIRYE